MRTLWNVLRFLLTLCVYPASIVVGLALSFALRWFGWLAICVALAPLLLAALGRLWRRRRWVYAAHVSGLLLANVLPALFMFIIWARMPPCPPTAALCGEGFSIGIVGM